MMKILTTLLLLLLVTACGMPESPGPVVNKNPPPAEVPTPEMPPIIPENDPTENPEETTPEAPVTVQEEINSYVRAFEARNLLAGGAPNPTDLQVSLETLATNILGTCSMNSRIVKLNTFYWSQLSAPHKEELVFHELGHCVLGRYHDDTLGSDRLPISIMNSYHMGPSLYIRSASAYRSYMAELFHTTSYTFSGLVFNESNYPTQIYASNIKPSSRSVQASTKGPEEIKCTHH